MAEESDQSEVSQFYTRTRRIPKFIGKFTDGTNIPGGPYTLTQGVALVLAVVLGFMTRPVWSVGMMLVDLVLMFAAAWGTALLVGRIPQQRRNLLSVIGGHLSATVKPPEGRLHGKKLKLPKPHGVRAKGAVIDPNDPYTAARPAPAAPVVAANAAAPSPAEPETPAPETPAHVSGAEALLLQMQGGA